ncbi:expressed unknown protein [Seminavis robusta]|uniref:Fucosyltransferase n=1 Tax=Seminavis robusta TaxID=568900 RepID=A0A9N8EI65_9STRA|nr:expressed unknown protein [Seminavis robusta]|eukprot:Sro974_g226710.1 n/a (511) ;mRNA; r:24190-25722
MTTDRSSSSLKLFSLVRNVVLTVAVWELLSFDTQPFQQQWTGASAARGMSLMTRDLKAWVDEAYQAYQAVGAMSHISVFSAMHLEYLATLTPSNPVYCYNSSFCCGRWDVDADPWWIHHPDWQVVPDVEDITDVGFCFAPIQNLDHKQTMQQLHLQQWGVDIGERNANVSLQELSSIIPESYNFTDSTNNTNAINCSNLVTTVPISSGYGASMSFLYGTFWFAFTQHLPFQIIKRGPWMYATANVNHSWAYCPDQDASCLYLPLSPCSRYRAEQPKQTRRANQRDHLQAMQWLWMRDYMARPNQGFRQALTKLQEPYVPLLKDSNCIALHVRRGDAGVPRKPFRRYAAIQEYLDLLPNQTANSKRTIFLLTDDASTIDELQQYHLNVSNPKFHWIYTNKTRNRGTEQGFDRHVPAASDGPEELLWITAELELAGRHCTTLLHGISGYAGQLLDRMRFYAGSAHHNNLTNYYLDTSAPFEEIQKYRGKVRQRESYLLDNIQSFYTNTTAEA